MTSAVLVGGNAVLMEEEDFSSDCTASLVGASVNWLSPMLFAGALVVLTSPALSWRSLPRHGYALTNPVFSVPDSLDELLLWCHEQRSPPPGPCSL